VKLSLTALALSTIVALTACGSDDSAPTDSGTGGADSSTTTDSGVATDSGTASDTGSETDTGPGTDGGGGSDTGTLPTGACSNAADQAVVAATDIPAEAESCGRGCFGAESCVTDCMRDDVGLTMACAACFGATSECTRSNCLTACLGSDAARCTMCRRMAGCLDSFVTCSGLPGE